MLRRGSTSCQSPHASASHITPDREAGAGDLAAGGGVRGAISSSSSSSLSSARELHETDRSVSRPNVVPAGVDDGVGSTVEEDDVSQLVEAVDVASATAIGGDGGASAGARNNVAAPAVVGDDASTAAVEVQVDGATQAGAASEEPRDSRHPSLVSGKH